MGIFIFCNTITFSIVYSKCLVKKKPNNLVLSGAFMMAVKCNDLNEQQRGTKFHLGWISYENERSRRVTRASSLFK